MTRLDKALTAICVVLAAGVIAAPSHAIKGPCVPEIVKVTVTGKPIVGHTLKSHVRVRCAG